jgi:hypothetical protein
LCFNTFLPFSYVFVSSDGSILLFLVHFRFHFLGNPGFVGFGEHELVLRIGDKASVIYPVSSFNGRSTTDAEDGMAASLQDRVVRNCLPASVIDLLTV